MRRDRLTRDASTAGGYATSSFHNLKMDRFHGGGAWPGPAEGAGEPVKEGEREPGEVGAGGRQEEPGGAGPQDGAHPRRHGLAQAFEERVDARLDYARGHVEEPLAAQEFGQGLVGVGAVAMEVDRAVGKAPQPFGAGGGGEPELNVREGVVEPRGGGCEDGLCSGRGGARRDRQTVNYRDHARSDTLAVACAAGQRSRSRQRAMPALAR